MTRATRRATLAGLAALALATSAVGPCHCLVTTAACQRDAEKTEDHGCCEKPAGVKAVAEECCDSSPELLVAATGVPEVTPPGPQAGPAGSMIPGERTISLPAVRVAAPPSLDRTTVLLI